MRWLRRLFASFVRHEAVKVELPLPIPQQYRELWSYAEEHVMRKDVASVREAVEAYQRIVDEDEFDTLPRLFQVATLGNLGTAYAQLYSASGDPGQYERSTETLEEAWRRLFDRTGADARMILDALAIAATDRFERTLTDRALDEMIARVEALLRLHSLEAATRDERRHNLMSGLQERIRRRGRGTGDERRLLELLDEALADRTPGRSVRALYANLRSELVRTGGE